MALQYLNDLTEKKWLNIGAENLQVYALTTLNGAILSNTLNMTNHAITNVSSINGNPVPSPLGNVNFAGVSATVGQIPIFSSVNGLNINSTTIPVLIDNSANLTGIGSLNSVVPAGLTTKVRCLYQPGSLLNPDAAYPRFNLWSQVQSALVNCNGMLDIYMSNASGSCIIDSSTDFQSRAQLYSYQNNALGVSVVLGNPIYSYSNVDCNVPDGVQLTNLRLLQGAGLNLICNPITALSPSLLFSNGSIFELFEGASLQLSATANQPIINIPDGEAMVIGFGRGGYISNSLNPTMACVNVGVGSTLILSSIENTNITGTTNDIISSTDGSATLILIYDSTTAENQWTFANFTGTIIYSPIDKALNMFYDDSLNLPSIGVSTVQAAIDYLKAASSISYPLLAPDNNTPIPYSFASSPTSGIWYASGFLNVDVGGVTVLQFKSNQIVNAGYSWNFNTGSISAITDLSMNGLLSIGELGSIHQVTNIADNGFLNIAPDVSFNAVITFASNSAKNLILNNTCTAPGEIDIQYQGTNVIRVGFNSVAFYDVAPVAQQVATGASGYASVSGTPVLSGDTFTGNVGSTAYTIGDLVAALKNYGLLAP